MNYRIMEDVLDIRQLSIGYLNKSEKKVVAENITETLKKGELVCLLGPNGAGKSTLIRTISGAQKPLEGQVLFEGKDISQVSSRQLATKLSLVLTERVHGGMLSSYEVVGLGRYPYTGWSGKLKPKDHEVVQWAIAMVGAQELAGRMLSELSDGERQKIMVAKALAQETEVMILDEITAFLDLPRRIEIMQLMRQLAKKDNKCVLMSTHDMELALKYADKLWLQPKNGKLVIGAPEDLVLDGSFARAFESEGIHFNMGKGAFEAQEPYHRSICLKGNGDGLLWTKKALERERIEVVNDAAISITVIAAKKGILWKVTSKAMEKEASSIYQLLQTIKEYD
ncbi:ABC transporter ATP-binding protein [Ulvibacterium sp.]|uniref:ABC transporter ATP-binding protein n=1 Tax=Ulvibacterium sp. TaxID=2665914 RepID=UPI003BA8AAFA